MNTARTAGIGQQVYTHYHTKNQTNSGKETRFSGQPAPAKTSAAQVMFGLVPDLVSDRLERVEEAALAGKTPLEQLVYRIGRIAQGSAKR